MSTATVDDFAPLSEAERSQPQHRPKDGSQAWRPILPVPDDAPPPQQHFGTLGAPVASWPFRDAEGRVLCYELRFFVDGKKEPRPLTFCEHTQTKRRAWRLKAPPKPYPLFGLDELAARSTVPVLVCEGAKTAEAAQRLFPDHAVVAALFGARSPQCADWSPLAGRNVIAWPDADEPGHTFAALLARLTLEAGAARVRLVTVPDTFPVGWDLADPSPKGWGVGRLRELLESAAARCEPEGDDAPEVAPDGIRFPFRLTAEAVEYREEWQPREGETQHRWARACSRVEVVAVTRDEHGEEWGRLLHVTDADGRTHEWAMPMRMLAGDGTALRERLADLGLEVEPGRKPREWLHAYLTSTKPAARVRCVSRIGWHGRAFVLPDAVFGDADTEPVRLQVAGAFEHAFRVSGSLAEWQREVAVPCEGNSRLEFAISASFAAAILALLEAESGGFHLRGSSSIGKTTALGVGGSVFGGGGLRGYVRQWRATANGLEGVAVGHCDTLLCLDELSQVDAREAGVVAYLLANGQGKARASRDGAARRAAEWRLLFLSSGELSLAEKVREDGRGRATAGQAVRVVDVPADAGRGHGLFEQLHRFENPAALADHLRRATAAYFGTAGHAFLAAVTRDIESATARLRETRAAFVGARCPAGADGQVRRVAERFGLLAAAGELASELGVLPWSAGAALAGVERCFDAWLEERGTAGPGELAEGVEQVRSFFAAHGSARFEPMGNVTCEMRVPNRAGWWRDDGTGRREWLVPPSVFKGELARGFDSKALASELVELGCLLPDEAGKTAQRVTIPGLGRLRVYRFTAAVLGDEV